MRNAGLAGATYFAAIFALGFLLGTVRILWLVPRVGETAAAALELPLMLASSAMVAHHLIQRFRLRSTDVLLVMGALAFVLLLSAELILGVVAFGMTPRSWAAGLLTGAGAVGLAGQVVFALMPLLVSLLRKSPPRA